MKISFQNLLSLYLTGRTSLTSSSLSTESNASSLTDQELDDLETTRELYEKSELESFKFTNQIFNLKADFNTVHGQFRMAGLGVINSFFSGIGAGFASKMSFFSGLGLAGFSLLASYLKKVPFLSTKFSILGFGGNLFRGTLHILDSIFSTIGEHGSRFTLPSLLASGFSLFSLNRSLKDKDNKSFELPYDTIGGTLGRTAVHHVDSMLASKAAQISNQNQTLGSLLASFMTTVGLLLPKDIKTKKIPWNTFEGFVAQGGTHFIDSLFSSFGNLFNPLIKNSKNILLASSGVLLGAPIIGSMFSSINYQIPFGSLEGRLVRGLFHAPENLVFNLGTFLGNSSLGIPLSLAFSLGTYLTCVSKASQKIKNIEISRDKIGGLIQRLPFHLVYSMISATGLRLSKLIPAPILACIGPALSFQIGEKFKNIDSKFDDMKGLLLRNTIHLWETILARGAYRAGRMLTGTQEEHISSGSILSDGRWLSDEGRIVPTMAIGKQVSKDSNNDFLNLILSSLSGIGIAFSSFALLNFLKGKLMNCHVNPSLHPPIKSPVHPLINSPPQSPIRSLERELSHVS